MKYKLTDETITYQGHKLYRIEAIVDFGNIKAGDKGGFVATEDNLSHEGNCWIYSFAGVPKVYGNACIKDNAKIYGSAVVGDNVVVKDNAIICGHAHAGDNAVICDEACICDHASICNNAVVSGIACITGDAIISNSNDFQVYKVPLKIENYITWTSNNKWFVCNVTKTSEELVEYGYEQDKYIGDFLKVIVETQDKITKLNSDKNEEMKKKYKLTNESLTYKGHILYRIEALMDFNDVKAGDKGGFIESEANLSQEGDCWIYSFGDCLIYPSSKKAMVYGNARIENNAKISGTVVVKDNATVSGNARIKDNAKIYGSAVVGDNAVVKDNAAIYGNAIVRGDAVICDEACVYDHASICNNAVVDGVAHIGGDAVISDVCDYLTFKLPHEELNYVTWTRSDNMWHNYTGNKTSEEFIQRGYKTSQFLGDWCKVLVKMQKKFAKLSKEK